MSRRRLLQGTEPPATEAVPFAAVVPASAAAMGAVPEDEEPPTTPPSADDVICDPATQASRTPGTTAMKAINEFKGETIGWLGPKKASLIAIRIQGYLQDKTAPAHADTNRLVCLAIRN